MLEKAGARARSLPARGGEGEGTAINLQTAADSFAKTMSMKALVFESYGEPTQVLQLREVPLPEPGRNQLRVHMLASPINPSDLLTVRGDYGRTAPLPATPGYEGVGVIDAVGPGLFKLVRGLRPGRRVAVPSGT